MSELSFAALAAQSLDAIAERMYDCEALEDADITISDGVLTIKLPDGGQFVINRQEPLRQIWLSSPEGPARFDHDTATGHWRHEHSGEELVSMLNGILSRRLGVDIRL